MERISKDKHYLSICKEIAVRSTCLRRAYGAIIVNHNEIISTGYNGAPRGRKNCCDLGVCRREQLCIPRGERYELCRSVHAEANCIISSARKDIIGGTLYLYGIDFDTGKATQDTIPCEMCKRFIINAGIDTVIVPGNDRGIIKYLVSEWLIDE